MEPSVNPEQQKDYLNRIQIIFALCMLIVGSVAGVIASLSYTRPGFYQSPGNFIFWRPVHVSAVVLWIITGAQGLLNLSLYRLTGKKDPFVPAIIRVGLIIFSGIAIFVHYFRLEFGGREYWEFPNYIAFFLMLAWVLQLYSVFARLKRLNKSHVYVWMWLTGSSFLVFIFAENYLWIFPGMHQTAIRDLMIQWKSAGSLVGAWNQIIYGLAMFVMVQVTGNDQPVKSKTAFTLYLLGAANLMFNWGHHIYTLPVKDWIRMLSYLISMTEWILFLRIMYFWPGRKAWADARKGGISGLFMYAADLWVLGNLLLALLMSIPALNIYTHGTHITVAHSMGTTIGINSMILLGTLFYFFPARKKWHMPVWITLQICLLIFWISLVLAGISKGAWMHRADRGAFSEMMQSLHPHFMIFSIFGTLIAAILIAIAAHLLTALQGKNNK